MNRLNTIIAGLDFSECSRSALEQAARMSAWNQATLRVIHAVEYLTFSDATGVLQLTDDQIRSEVRQQAIARLATWVNEAGAPDRHSREVIFGPPSDVLLQETRTSRADLLVLGVTGDSLLPYGAGVLATKCLRKAPCKVMLVKERHARPFRRIVAGVDFSDTSCEVVVQSLRLASQDRAEVHFLHVFPPSWEYAFNTDPLVPDSAAAVQALLVATNAQRHLALQFPLVTAASDITCHIESSPDLESWLPGCTYSGTNRVTATLHTTEFSRTGAGRETVVVYDNIPVETAPQRFLRLAITEP